MRESRNPFRLRSAEQIESEATFLRLFEPSTLDVLPDSAFGEARVLVLRSAPGAGKTSLLRVFTPQALQTLRANANREDFKDVYERVRSLGALNDERIVILGVRLSCAQTYAGLEDAGPPAIADRLLFGLINARLTVAALRDVAAALRSPLDSTLAQIKLSGVESSLPDLRKLRTGLDLFEWAQEVENDICSALDSFAPESGLGARGHDALHALTFLADARLGMAGSRLPDRIAVMFDDVHLLTARQRQRLLDEIVRMRTRLPVWMAERYEALSASDILSLGAAQGRDVLTVYIEEHWRSKPKRFESFVKNVADKRAAASVDVDMPTFETCLHESLDPDRWEAELNTGLAAIQGRLRKIVASSSRYSDWIGQREGTSGTLLQRVVEWRALEILIERERRRTQLDFGLPLTVHELERRDDADVHRAAELFVANELGLPLYYGSSTLATIASTNVDQYLGVAGDMFEEALAAALMHRPVPLSAERQDAMVRAAAMTRWSEIPARVPNGRRVREFLLAAGTFAQQQTYRPTAPYSPGITGFAYAMDEHKLLLERFPELAGALASAIADNLLEARPDYSCKGRRWMVLFFNRLLCARFGLPVGYGGFKEQRLTELQSWFRLGPRGISKSTEEAA